MGVFCLSDSFVDNGSAIHTFFLMLNHKRELMAEVEGTIISFLLTHGPALSTCMCCICSIIASITTRASIDEENMFYLFMW